MGVRVRKKHGQWYIFINHNGQRKSKKVGHSRSEATAVARKLEAKLALGEPLWPEDEEAEDVPTLEEYFRHNFSRTYLKGGVRSRTQSMYKATFEKRILPVFGKHRLNEITRDEVKRFVASLVETKIIQVVSKKKKNAPPRPERTLSKASIRIILSNFSAVMNHAKEDGLIVENPAARLTKFYREASFRHDEIQPLTAEEVPVFLEAVQNHAPEYYTLFGMAIHTGMRAGELIALRWIDIDWNGKFANVRHSASRNATAGKTKTGNIRKVDLSDSLINELEALHQKRKAQFLRKKRGLPEWVFCNGEGKQLDLHNIRNRHFYRCLRLAKLRRIRFHDLRHTFATLLVMQGESLSYVQNQLGHASITMTVNVYTHWLPGSNRQAVNKLPSLERRKASNVLQVKRGAQEAR